MMKIPQFKQCCSNKAALWTSHWKCTYNHISTLGVKLQGNKALPCCCLGLPNKDKPKKKSDKQTLTCFPAHLFFVEFCLPPQCIALCPRSVHVLRCLERFPQSPWTPAHPSPDRRLSLPHLHRCPRLNSSAIRQKQKPLSRGKCDDFVPVGSISSADKMIFHWSGWKMDVFTPHWQAVKKFGSKSKHTQKKNRTRKGVAQLSGLLLPVTAPLSAIVLPNVVLQSAEIWWKMCALTLVFMKSYSPPNRVGSNVSWMSSHGRPPGKFVVLCSNSGKEGWETVRSSLFASL